MEQQEIFEETKHYQVFQDSFSQREEEEEDEERESLMENNWGIPNSQDYIG